MLNEFCLKAYDEELNIDKFMEETAKETTTRIKSARAASAKHSSMKL